MTVGVDISAALNLWTASAALPYRPTGPSGRGVAAPSRRDSSRCLLPEGRGHLHWPWCSCGESWPVDPDISSGLSDRQIAAFTGFICAPIGSIFSRNWGGSMGMKSRVHHIRGALFYAAALLAILGASLTSPQQALAQLPPLPGGLVVTITSPTSGATVAGTITVNASVSPLGVLVGGVQFKLDGANLGTEDTAAPYSVSWNTTTAGNGSHTLTAVARDALGLLYGSNPVTVTVSNAPPPDTTPPTVSITAPASGATVSGTTTVSASASDNVGVAGVQFLVDGSNLGSEDTSSPYSVSWNTTTASNGSHSLTAVARDAAGNRTTSSAVSVTVSNTSPPSTTRFEETAATLAPAGTWSQTTSASTGVTLSGGQAVYAGAAGATASFTFSGTGVSWIGFQCEQCGIASVHLDGSVVATVDTYAPNRPAASGAMYSTTGLASGRPTLVIEATRT